MTSPTTELTFSPADPTPVTDGVLISVTGPVGRAKIVIKNGDDEVNLVSPEFGQKNRTVFTDQQVVLLDVLGSPAGGSYKLGVYDRLASTPYGTTAAIAHNASAATVKTRLAALVGADNVTVLDADGGTSTAKPYRITFTGDVSEKFVSVTVEDNSLTGGTSPAPSLSESTDAETGGTEVAGGPYLWGPVYLSDAESAVADVISTYDFPDDGIYEGDSLLSAVVEIYDFGDL